MECEATEDFVARLRATQKTIIVEGERDKKALQELGINNIVTLKKPIFAVVEEVASRSRDVIILTDMDRKGKELYGRLSTGLQRYGVRIDHYFREFILKNTKLRQVEGIAAYMEGSRW